MELNQRASISLSKFEVIKRTSELKKRRIKKETEKLNLDMEKASKKLKPEKAQEGKQRKLYEFWSTEEANRLMDGIC